MGKPKPANERPIPASEGRLQFALFGLSFGVLTGVAVGAFSLLALAISYFL